MAVDPSGLISRAASLARLPASQWGPIGSIPTGWAPSNPFTAPVITAPAGSATPPPAYLDPQVPTPPGVTGSVAEAAYAAVEAVLNASVPTIPSVRDDGVGVVPGAPPNPQVAAPPLDYPVLRGEPGAYTPLYPLAFSAPVMGEVVPLTEIDVTPFMADTLTPFAGDLPVATLPDVTWLTPPETPNAPDASALLARMRTVLEQGVALSEASQAQWMAEKLDDLARKEHAARQAILGATAARGFALPTGAAERELIAVALAGAAQREAAHREVSEAVYAQALELFTTALEGITRVEIGQYALALAYAETVLGTFSFNVRIAATVLEAAVAVHREQVRALRLRVEDYNAYVRALRAQNTAALAMATGVEAQLNTQRGYQQQARARLQTAQAGAEVAELQVQTATIPIEHYAAYLGQVRAQVEQAGLTLQGYQTAVDAFGREGEWIVAQLRASAEAAVVQATTLGVDEARDRAVLAQNRAVLESAQIEGQVRQEVTRTLAEQVRHYDAYAEAQRAYLAGLTQQLSAVASQASDWEQATRSATQYTTLWNKAEASRAAAENQYGLLEADQRTRQSALEAERVATQARIDAGRLAAQAQEAAGRAQAAYGVTSGSVRLSGTVSLDKGSRQTTHSSFDTDATRRYSVSRSWGSESET